MIQLVVFAFFIIIFVCFTCLHILDIFYMSTYFLFILVPCQLEKRKKKKELITGSEQKDTVLIFLTRNQSNVSGYICRNSQKYIVWVKIIAFSSTFYEDI